MKIKWGIIIVLIIGLFFRVYRLNNLPVSMFGDEVDASYHAWSLATTLHDYRGHFLPSYIQSFAEWRAPLEMYVVAPFVGLMGPSTFSARLPMALLGVLSIYLTYLIINLLFPEERHLLPIHSRLPDAGTIAALVLALTPWHIHYTRNVVEQPPLFALILLGVYFYLKAKNRPIFYPLSLFFFILTFYTYSIANLATPFIVIILLICFPPKVKDLIQKKTLGGLFISFLTVIPIAYQILFGQAAGRFKLINIANDHVVLEQIVLDRNRPWLASPLLEKIFNNKLTAVGGEFAKNYLTAISPEFLFITGDPIYRQNVDKFGAFLLVLAPFFFIGLFVAIFRKNKSGLFLVLWFLLIPIGSSLTQGGGNHGSRLFLQNFPVVSFIAIGIMEVIDRLNKKLKIVSLLLILAFITLNFSAYWYRYTTHYAYESSHVWQYGYEPLYVGARKFIPSAKRVFINNTFEPALYRFAFYYPILPSDFLKTFKSDAPISQILPGFNGYRYGDKFFFGQADNFEAMVKLLQPGDIYIAAQGREIPGDWDLEKATALELKVLLTVRDFYQRPLFYILSK